MHLSPKLSSRGLELLQHIGAHSCTIDCHHDASSADYEIFDNCLHLLDCNGHCDELGSQWLWYSTYLRCKKMGLSFSICYGKLNNFLVCLSRKHIRPSRTIGMSPAPRELCLFERRAL